MSAALQCSSLRVTQRPSWWAQRPKTVQARELWHCSSLDGAQPLRVAEQLPSVLHSQLCRQASWSALVMQPAPSELTQARSSARQSAETRDVEESDTATSL